MQLENLMCISCNQEAGGIEEVQGDDYLLETPSRALVPQTRLPLLIVYSAAHLPVARLIHQGSWNPHRGVMQKPCLDNPLSAAPPAGDQASTTRQDRSKPWHVSEDDG